MTKYSADEEGEGTSPPAERRCRWCRFPLAEHDGPGRPRKFCSQPCRQWDWVSRQRARELALSDGELVMARSDLDALYDGLFVLEAAVSDTRRALDHEMTSAELLTALRWLLDAAAPLTTGRQPTVSPQAVTS